MTNAPINPHIGSSFDDFLEDQGILEDCEHHALKEILADQVRQTMTDKSYFKNSNGYTNENK